MNRLLRANFRRLWKNKLFWGCMIFMLADALNTVVGQYISFRRSGGDKEMYFSASLSLDQTMAVSVIAAIFIGLFIGTEYSCGTMRNKLAIGHGRAAIYFSNLAVCVAAAVIIHAAYFAAVIIGGLTAFGNFITSPGELAKLFAVSLAVVIAFAALLLPISTLITSKSAGVATAIMTSFVMLIAAIFINSGLTEPAMKNPYYVSGIKRQVYEALYDILPSCQAARIQLGDMPENPAVFPLWSAAVIAVTTACGAAGFRRKDLK